MFYERELISIKARLERFFFFFFWVLDVDLENFS